MTSIANVVASVAQIALQIPRVDLIRDLERDSQTLDRIGDSFGRILDKRTLAVWSFAEELAITGIGKVCMSPIYRVLGLTVLARSCLENRPSLVTPARIVKPFMATTLVW